MTTTISGTNGIDRIQDGAVVQADLASPYYLPSPQTWQDVIGSRVSGTTYTNGTGLPVMVSVTSTLAVSGGLTVIVAGLQVAKQFITSPSTCNACIAFMVPAGATYSVTAAVVAIATWMELR